MKTAMTAMRTASLWAGCIGLAFALGATGMSGGEPAPAPDVAPVGVLDSLAGRLAALGWTGAAGSIDALASGTLTVGGRTERFVLKAKVGARQRTERPDSGIVVVVNNGRGYVLNNGKQTPLKLHECIAAVPWMFPFLTPLVQPESAQIAPSPKQDSAFAVYKFSKSLLSGIGLILSETVTNRHSSTLTRARDGS